MKSWSVRPATARELARLYQVSYHIFKSHLKPFADEIGRRIGHYYTVKQVIIIINKLGPPPEIDIDYPRE